MDDAQPRRRPGGSRRSPDQAMADLVGAGRSQLDPVRAMRARDVDRPSEDDVAEAERDVVIVRRHWQPPPDQTSPVRS